MVVKIASAGVSQGRISLQHPFLRWPVTIPKAVYQHQYWLQGGKGERSASVCLWSCAMLQTQPGCCLPAKDRTWRVFHEKRLSKCARWKLRGLKETRYLSCKGSPIKGLVRLLDVPFFYLFNFKKMFLNLNSEHLLCYGQNKYLPLWYSFHLLKQQKPCVLLCKSNAVHLLMVKSSGQILLNTLVKENMPPLWLLYT